ncbi:hypothetical protein [Streptococcus catagoni]|uniref:hypothetical protein n=1 Tax=Streptococcus catagoni TaxID=2654874 RepID=UPI0014098B0B|nr:hypothetical protein [Streptococcus catagoni]
MKPRFLEKFIFFTQTLARVQLVLLRLLKDSIQYLNTAGELPSKIDQLFCLQANYNRFLILDYSLRLLYHYFNSTASPKRD